MENKESFYELYTRLYNENYNELEILRKKEKKQAIKIILLLMMTIVAMVIFQPLGIVLFIVSFVYITKSNLKSIKNKMEAVKTRMVNGEAVSSSILKGEQSYGHVFKEKIITPIIEYVFPGAKYTPDFGIDKYEYNKGNWESYDRYSSEDKIITDIELDKETKLQITIAEVHTENRHEDKDGHVSYSTVFHGLVGIVNLPKNINCYLKVKDNGFNLFGGPKDRLKMDMTEFEKMFDVKTNDKIKAMQILTSDIMVELIDLVKTSKIEFEFYINNDIMHIRFHIGEMFEPEVFKKSMQYEKIKKCFDKVGIVKNVTGHICNVINEQEF